MTLGVLPEIYTLVDGIINDVSRGLNYNDINVLKIVRPDATSPTKFTDVLVLTSGFNRVGGDEVETREGHSVVFVITDTLGDGSLQAALRTKEAFIDFDGALYKITHIPTVPPDVGQTYEVTCGTRTMQRAYFKDARK